MPKRHHISALCKNKKVFIPFLVVLFALVGIVFVYALNTWNTGYAVNKGASAIVRGGDNGSVCRKVTNNCDPGTIFVPTANYSEWNGPNGFLNKKPSCVSIEMCPCSSNNDCSSSETCGPSSNTIAPTFYNVTNVCVGTAQRPEYGQYGARIYNPGYALNAINVTPSVTSINTTYWKSGGSSTAGIVNRNSVWINSDCAGGIDALRAGAELTISYVYNNTGSQRTVYVGLAGDNYFRLKFNGTKIVEVTDTSATTHTQFAYFHLLPVTLNPGYNTFEALGRGDGSVSDALTFMVFDNTSAQLQNATSDSNLKILFTAKSLVTNGTRITAATCAEGYYLDTSAGANNYVCRSNIGQCVLTVQCRTNADCSSPTPKCQGYVPSSSAAGTCLHWERDDSGLSSSISDAETRGCIESLYYGTFPSIPSFAPTYARQIGNSASVYWEGIYYRNCNEEDGQRQGAGDVFWQAVPTSATSCSSQYSDGLSCSASTCTYIPGATTPETLGKCGY